jgi:hypothetical protein
MENSAMNTPHPIDRPGAGTPGPVEWVPLRHPRDLPAVVPYLLRYHPNPGSLVAVALHRGRVAVTLRVDATRMVADDMPGVWDRLARPLAEAGTDHVAVIGYLPAAGQDLLLAFAGACPAPVLDVQRVHDGRWWSLTCPNGPDCCPPGQPVAADPALVAPLIAAAGAPAVSRDEVAACLEPGPVDQVSAVAGLLPVSPAPPPATLFRAVVDAHTACVDGPIRLPAQRAALLLQALQDLRIRDLCCGWSDDASWFLWTTLVRYAPASHVPPVAALIATTAYQRGDTVLARMAAEHALAFDPGYGLGQLMLGVAQAQIHPATVREILTGALAEMADLPGYRELGLTPGPGSCGDVAGGDGDG